MLKNLNNIWISTKPVADLHALSTIRKVVSWEDLDIMTYLILILKYINLSRLERHEA